MSAPTLSTVQTILADLLIADQARTGSLLAGIPLAREQFGHMDPTDDASNPDGIATAALSEDGPGVVIYLPYPILTLGSSFEGGRATVKCIVSLFLLVNPEQNERGAGGINRDPLTIVQAIWASVLGKSRGPLFQLGPSPMGIPSDESAVRSYPIDFECTLMV